MTVCERILTRTAKRRAVDRLVKFGWSDVGGSKVKISRERAEYLIDQVEDEAITQHTVQTGALGDGGLLLKIREFIEWLGSEEGQARLAALIKFIISIAALFAI